MKNNEASESELERLNVIASLNIMDTGEEERFNRITRIVKKAFDVPIAYIGLFDEKRQWFKSSIGMKMPEISRDLSICSHTFNSGRVLVVSDTFCDSRFSGNPMVTGEPFARFYAGIPLKAGCSILGTLGIIDTNPREFSSEETLLLEDIASLAETELAMDKTDDIPDVPGIHKRGDFFRLVQNALGICFRQKIKSGLVLLHVLDEDGSMNKMRIFMQKLGQAARRADVYGYLGKTDFAVWLGNVDLASAQIFVDRLKSLLSAFNKDADSLSIIDFTAAIIPVSPFEQSTVSELLIKGSEEMKKLIQKKTSATA